jgi:hypothetical protein
LLRLIERAARRRRGSPDVGKYPGGSRLGGATLMYCLKQDIRRHRRGRTAISYKIQF